MSWDRHRPATSRRQAPPRGRIREASLTAFVTKLDPSGSALLYSTFLGGSVVDGAYGVAGDTAGSAYVVGGTLSPDFPSSEPGARRLRRHRERWRLRVGRLRHQVEPPLRARLSSTPPSWAAAGADEGSVASPSIRRGMPT